MEFWVGVATIMGVLVTIGVPLTKIIHRAMTRALMTEMLSIKSDLMVVMRDQKKAEIENRGVRLRVDVMTDSLQDAFFTRDQTRNMNKKVHVINERIANQLDETDKEFQMKLEEIEKVKEKITNGKG